MQHHFPAPEPPRELQAQVRLRVTTRDGTVRHLAHWADLRQSFQSVLTNLRFQVENARYVQIGDAVLASSEVLVIEPDAED